MYKAEWLKISPWNRYIDMGYDFAWFNLIPIKRNIQASKNMKRIIISNCSCIRSRSHHLGKWLPFVILISIAMTTIVKKWELLELTPQITGVDAKLAPAAPETSKGYCSMFAQLIWFFLKLMISDSLLGSWSYGGSKSPVASITFSPI